MVSTYRTPRPPLTAPSYLHTDAPREQVGDQELRTQAHFWVQVCARSSRDQRVKKSGPRSCSSPRMIKDIHDSHEGIEDFYAPKETRRHSENLKLYIPAFDVRHSNPHVIRRTSGTMRCRVSRRSELANTHIQRPRSRKRPRLPARRSLATAGRRPPTPAVRSQGRYQSSARREGGANDASALGARFNT